MNDPEEDVLHLEFLDLDGVVIDYSPQVMPFQTVMVSVSVEVVALDEREAKPDDPETCERTHFLGLGDSVLIAVDPDP
jgi:hypothetical protein